ncbi:unnamed protein product [Sphagnum troendelagicum]
MLFADVRQKNSRSPTPPKNSIKAMTRMKSSPLIAEKKFCIQEGITLCGIVLQIRQAWSTVHETLFLWPSDEWYASICSVNVPYSFCGVNLEIVSIDGPMKLVLLGISYNCDGSGDPNAQLCLQPLPQYMIPTHGVMMTCSMATDKGCIFLGGRDGHLYELLYTIGTEWES